MTHCFELLIGLIHMLQFAASDLIFPEIESNPSKYEASCYYVLHQTRFKIEEKPRFNPATHQGVLGIREGGVHITRF